jgi:hypothetical protein
MRGEKIFVALFLFILVSAPLVLGSGDLPFKVDSVLIKSSLKEDGSFTTQLRLEALEKDLDFEVQVEGLDEFVSIEESSFSLKKGEVKQLVLEFSNSQKKDSGIYLGKLFFISGEFRKKVPVILEIESKDVLFDSKLELFPPSTIVPGEELNADITIFDLSNIGTSSIGLSYFIDSFDKERFLFGHESVVADDNYRISKSFDVPKDFSEGEYVFGVLVSYKNYSFATSSVVFKVENENISDKFVLSNALLWLAILVIFVILLAIIFYSIYSRDKLLAELRNNYQRQLRAQEDTLVRKENENARLLKTSQERNLNRELFQEIRRKTEESFKKEYKDRKKQLKVLKKKGKKDKLFAQLKAWKKKGYDTSVLEEKIKPPTVNDVRKQIKAWKKKGYDTSVLEK